MNINKYKQTAGTGHPDRNRNQSMPPCCFVCR